MQLLFSDVRKKHGEALHVAGVMPSRKPEKIREVQAISPLTFQGETRWEDGGVRLTGVLSYTAQLTCVCCLKAFEASFRVSVDERFRPAAVASVDDRTGGRGNRRKTRPGCPGESAAEEDASGLNVEVIAGEAIDVERVLQELSIVHLPWTPVCRADCRGLCPSCGRDLNEATCDCALETIDPRWLALRSLRDHL
ncbi:MAG: DUF177 domain-containing protein [Hydrogenibacillus sp.]|nr:DUF177 domain-containing protein [Hydrogenibacillus sp.]